MFLSSKRKITLGLLCGVLVAGLSTFIWAAKTGRVHIKADPLTGQTFSDVPDDYWAALEIQAAYQAKIVEGYPDGTFRPEVTVTRDQEAVYLARAVAGGDDKVPAPVTGQTLPSAPPNLVTNGGFENGLTGWIEGKYNVRSTVETSGCSEGSKCIGLLTDGVSQYTLTNTTRVAANGGEKYQISAKVKTSSGVNQLKLILRSYKSYYTSIGEDSVLYSPTGPGNWTTISKEVTLPAGTTAMEIALQWGQNAAAGELHIDDVKLSKATVAKVVAPVQHCGDVAPDNWAYKYVEYLVSQNIITDCSNSSPETNLYQPQKVMTRSYMAILLARAVAGGDAKVPDGPVTATFPDVIQTNQAYKYVEYLSSNGIVQGYPDGTYRPNDSVTRAQLAVFVTRGFDLIETALVSNIHGHVAAADGTSMAGGYIVIDNGDDVISIDANGDYTDSGLDATTYEVSIYDAAGNEYTSADPSSLDNPAAYNYSSPEIISPNYGDNKFDFTGLVKVQ